MCASVSEKQASARIRFRGLEQRGGQSHRVVVCVAELLDREVIAVFGFHGDAFDELKCRPSQSCL